MTVPRPLPRRLPLEVAPVLGEGLDSWLEALARRLTMPACDLLPALGLDVGPARSRTTAFATHLRAGEIARLAAATGTPSHRIQAMTLTAYKSVVDEPGADTDAGRIARHAWTRRRGSWFCPYCLAETRGRWQLWWRVGGSFACTRHRCLLADRCPACEQAPQLGTVWAQVPQASLCATSAAGQARQPCGADLTTTPVQALAAGHPALATQQRLDAVMPADTVTFGVYTAIPSARVLTDVTVMASRTLRYTAAPAPDDEVLGDLADAYRDALTSTHREDGTWHRANALVAARPVLTAVATTRALDVLGTAAAARVLVSLHTPGAAAQGLVAGFYSRRATPITASLDHVLSQARRELFSRLLPSQAPTARPLTPDGARRDLLGAEQTRPRHDRGAAIPTVFWPWWTLRVAPHWCRHRLTRTAFACLTLASGTTLSIPRALNRLQPEASRGHVSWVLRHLLEEPAWNGLRTALARLAAHLDEHGSPIDYDRRRALNYSGLLPEQRWTLLLDRTELRHTPALLRVVRGVLFETLSGRPASHAPTHFAAATTEQRDAISDFPAVLTTRLTGELHAVASEFLAAQRIDEPVTWQPPTALADGLDLPGPSPDTLAAGPLHELLAAGLPLQRAATHAGLPLDAARFLLSHQPPEITGGPHPEPDLAAQLPADLLRDLYVHRGLSISELAARYQVNRRRIRTLATDYGITLRDPKKPPPGITKRWLRDQYVRRGRSSEDLASELGLQSVTILRWCRKYDLPVRAVGGNGHRSALYDIDKAPAELRPALTGSRPWKRLAAFVQLPRHSSLRATADTLGLHHKTLTKYIQRLERELDQQLLHRAPAAPYAYTTLTSEGLALVETVTAFLERTSRTSRATLTRLPASVAFSRRPRRDRAQR